MARKFSSEANMISRMPRLKSKLSKRLLKTPVLKLQRPKRRRREKKRRKMVTKRRRTRLLPKWKEEKMVLKVLKAWKP